MLIRTEEMDRTAEYGIAVNYRFPAARGSHVGESEWLRRLLQSVGFASVVSEEPKDYHKDHWPCLRLVARKGNGTPVV